LRRPGSTAPEKIQVDGLEIEIRRKPIRTLNLHVEQNGSIWLSTPHHTTVAEATGMIRRHRTWLERRLAGLAAPAPPQLWGGPAPSGLDGPRLDLLYRNELARALEPLAACWGDHVGQLPDRWTLRWMTTRWGSCNARTRRISLNLALAALPMEYLEQVLVHELVHLTEPNHGPGFQARMDGLLPDWRRRRSAMRAFKPIPQPV
jgi:predicted metal-dependent hydrolase